MQLVSTRSEDFCLNYIVKVSKNLMQCLVSNDINLSVGTAKLFWLVSSLDAGIQQLWRNMDIVGFIASALTQLAKDLPSHEYGTCIYELYRELDHHDPDIEKWDDLSAGSSCGQLTLLRIRLRNCISV